ncbi:MAG TPA: DUF2511 domain-containing protein [Candidatus Competibacteraceae bacterium]|nr:DUF2511 domain-containing protein [Candidatus Competibacteraceae bacterium]HRZ06830.1 DUF2511 domain-containing protein [Candidatus Competibacteraceae bacterium]HSA46138.1 DUF2511 domain-containing protein [Candidatus Competibacteraceae bacterium]
MEQFENSRKTNALLQLALKYHNAKRYNEAAWLYQKIIDIYPRNMETTQHAHTNLNNLKMKIENLQFVKPKELQSGDPLLDDNEIVNIDSTITLEPSFIYSIKKESEKEKNLIRKNHEPKPTSLIECKDCRLLISKKAKSCPNCGAPQSKKTSFLGWLTKIWIGLIFFWAIISLNTQKSTSISYAGGVEITESEYGEEWPLTVKKGTLNCTSLGTLGIITFTVNGITYAVNGTAKARARQNDWREINEIWRDNPNPQYGPKINIAPLVQKGLSLCK